MMYLKRIRSSTKIFVGFVAIVSILWFGYNKVQDYLILGQTFTPISPKQVNIVGITPDGYKVIVSNEVAQLVETQGTFSADETDGAGGDDGSDGSVKKKISVKDMMGVLQGQSKSLSSFVMAMNDINENDLPPIRVIWSKADIEKVLHGDSALTAKLEKDLNVKLDGTPLSKLNINSVQNGIVLEIPITVSVLLDGKPSDVTGNVLLAYKPKLVKAMEADIAKDPGKINDSVITGYYKLEAENELAKPNLKENIRDYLKEEFSDETAQSYTKFPKQILKTAFVVVNDRYIEEAHYSSYTSPNGKPLYTLHVTLNDEGRKRLWQYSRRRVGDQILLTSSGVAIAAARIQHSLMGSDVSITNMSDQGLLDDLIATIKSAKSGKVAQR